LSFGSDRKSGSRVRAELGRGALVVAEREAGWEDTGLVVLMIWFIVESASVGNGLSLFSEDEAVFRSELNLQGELQVWH
jgi:hypothetical protein